MVILHGENMFLYTENSYVFDLKGFFTNNRRKKSQECGVLDFFTQISITESTNSTDSKKKTHSKFGLILAVYLFTCNRNFAPMQNSRVVRSAF